MLEPDRTTIFALEPFRAVGEAACCAAGTFRVRGAVEEGDVLVSDILEPVGRLVRSGQIVM